MQWKKNGFEEGLMRDVFGAWKTRRLELRWALNRVCASQVKDYQRSLIDGFLKIRNYGLNQRDILN